MNTVSRVIRNTGFLYMKMGVTMFVSLYATRLVLNALGVDDFGIFNMVAGVIAMLAFLNASMAAATQRFMSYAEGEGDPEKQKIVFNISVVLHLAIAVMVGILLYAAAPILFGHVLNIPEDRVFAARCVYWAMIASTVFGILGVPCEAMLNAHENMLYFAVIGVLESFLKLGAALLVVHVLADKLVLYGVLMAGISILAMTAMLVYCRRNYAECVIAPRRYWKRGVFREMGSFAGWNFTGFRQQHAVGIRRRHRPEPLFRRCPQCGAGRRPADQRANHGFFRDHAEGPESGHFKKRGGGQPRPHAAGLPVRLQIRLPAHGGFRHSPDSGGSGTPGPLASFRPRLGGPVLQAPACQNLAGTAFPQPGVRHLRGGEHPPVHAGENGFRDSFPGRYLGILSHGIASLHDVCGRHSLRHRAGGLLALSICVRRLGLSLRDFSFQVLAPCLVPSAATFAAGILLSRIDASLSPVPVLFRTCSLLVVFLLFLWFFSLDGRERGTLVFFLKSAWRKIQFSK